MLQPLAQKLDDGAATANERGFVNAYGADLSAALAHCREFSRGGSHASCSLLPTSYLPTSYSVLLAS